MPSVKIVLREDKIGKNGEAPLYLRIIKDRKTKMVSLRQRILPKDWNADLCKVRRSHPNSARMNAFLAEKVAEAERVSLEMEAKDRNVNSRQIKEQLLGKSAINYFDYAEQQIERMRRKGSFGTADAATVCLKRLERFYGSRSLFFSDLTLAFLNRFRDYLEIDLNLKAHTVHTTLKYLRTNCNQAVQEDLIPLEQNPFVRYKLRAPKTETSYLSEEELAAIEALDLPVDHSLRGARDMFVFACWAGGLRVADLLAMRQENVQLPILIFVPRKTGRTHKLKLPTRAIELLAPYHDPKAAPDSFLFPFLRGLDPQVEAETLARKIRSKTAAVNRKLKQIQEMASIEQPLHFHLSRHTWGTRALRKGMRMEYVSKNMGHSDMRITQHYAKLIQSEVDDAMDVFE